MPDLTDWLVEVLAADERAARGADVGAPWSGFTRDHWYVNAGGEPVARINSPERAPDTQDHIARHDPQSVLARIEGERMLAARHSATINDFGDTVCSECDVIEDGMRSEGQWPCETLSTLAWGYRHREGFDRSWAPEGVEVGA